MTSPQVTGEPGVTHQSKEYFVHFVIDLGWQSFEFSYPSLFGGFTTPAVLYPQLAISFISTHFWYLSSSVAPLPHLICLLLATKTERVVHFHRKGILMGAGLFSSCFFSHRKQVQVPWASRPFQGTKFPRILTTGGQEPIGILHKHPLPGSTVPTLGKAHE